MGEGQKPDGEQESPTQKAGDNKLAVPAQPPSRMAQAADAFAGSVIGAQQKKQVLAIRESVDGPAKTMLFSFGFAAGVVGMMCIFALIAPFTAVTAPMAFILCTSTGVASGLLFTRVFPTKDSLTSEEHLEHERALALRNRLLADLDEQAKELETQGLSVPEIAARLGPERDEAHQAYRAVVRKLRGPI